MAFKKWEKTSIITDNGVNESAITPVIVSASRSTDIPAFYGDWLLWRIRQGYVRWRNPFNGKDTFVSFEKARVFVFWSKNPGPFLQNLKLIERLGYGYLIHMTLNDYEQEGLEKQVPPLQDRIECFKQMSLQAGKYRTLWRFDPVILTDQLTPSIILDRIKRIGDQIVPYTSRLTISLITYYQKVKRALSPLYSCLDPSPEAVCELMNGLGTLSKEWGIPIVTCADLTDYSSYGVNQGACIDGTLLYKTFSHDPLLIDFLSPMANQVCIDGFGSTNVLKDPGQRSACLCTVSKDIGCYDTCPHHCLYCYANSSHESVAKYISAGRVAKGDRLLIEP